MSNLQPSFSPAAARPSDPPPGSLLQRLRNVFATPDEVFQDVVHAPFSPGNWILPILLCCLAGVVSAQLLLQEPTILDPIRSNPELRQLVHQADNEAKQALGEDSDVVAAARFATCLGIASACLVGTAWSAFVLWSLGAFFLRTRFSFTKTLEIVGLAQMILFLETIVTTLLTLATGHPSAKPALSLLLDDFNPTNRWHLVLETMNLFHLWTAAVLATGLSKLGRVTWAEAAFWVFGYWLVLRLGLILLRGG